MLIVTITTDTTVMRHHNFSLHSQHSVDANSLYRYDRRWSKYSPLRTHDYRQQNNLEKR